jgi:hypothetical protein
LERRPLAKSLSQKAQASLKVMLYDRFLSIRHSLKEKISRSSIR